MPSWNTNEDNSNGVTGVTIMNSTIARVDDITSCTFSVNTNLKVTPPRKNRVKTFNLKDNAYHIMLAYGPTRGDRLKEHYRDYVTRNKVKLRLNAKKATSQKVAVELKQGLNCSIALNGCLANPEGCESDPKTCTEMVSMTVDGEFLQIQIRGSNIADEEEYLLAGISTDADIGDDLIFACFKDGNATSVKSNAKGGVNVNAEVSEVDFQEVTVTGNLECTLTIKNTFTGTPVVLISGRGKQSKKMPKYNSPSDESVILGREFISKPSTEEGEEGGEESYAVVRAHGACMVIAWLGFGASGIIFSRYMKGTFKATKVFGMDIWFITHAMTSWGTLILTITGFILILFEEGWELELKADITKDNPHNLLGFYVLILALCQPVFVIFRPKPDSPKRWIFSWLHGGVGHMAWVMAFVTVILAPSLGDAEFISQGKFCWSLFGYGVVHFVAHLTLSILKDRAMAAQVADPQWAAKESDAPMGGGYDEGGGRGRLWVGYLGAGGVDGALHSRGEVWRDRVFR